jgi:DnaJ-domain-containing protein 1
VTLSFTSLSLVAPFAVMTLGAGQALAQPDLNAPTALEAALTERACSIGVHAVVTDPDTHTQCVSTQLAALRTDFGRDLRRLSAVERSGLDSSCSRNNTPVTREAYLDCLNQQLVVLRTKRTRTARGATEAPAAAPVVPAAAPAEAPAPQPGVPRSTLLAAVAVAVIAFVATGGLVFIRLRRSRHTCRTCGQIVGESSDLCAPCRAKAADVLKRAAAERAEQKRAAEQEERRKKAVEEELRQKTAQQEEQARLRQTEEACRREEEAQKRAAEEAERKSKGAVTPTGAEDTFDPYAVLGVPRGAGVDAIRAAYDEAKSKYDPDAVSHLGVDVQEYYKTKAEAVARAYEMLSTGVPQDPACAGPVEGASLTT